VTDIEIKQYHKEILNRRYNPLAVIDRPIRRAVGDENLLITVIIIHRKVTQKKKKKEMIISGPERTAQQLFLSGPFSGCERFAALVQPQEEQRLRFYLRRELHRPAVRDEQNCRQIFQQVLRDPK
jgi:hypothetical protein